MAKRKGRRRRFGRRKRMRKAFNGGLVRGRMHPPTSTAAPWNCIALYSTWTASGEDGVQCVNLDALRTGIKVELGLKNDVDLDIRLMRVDVWVPPPATGTDKNYIVLSPSDWSLNAVCAGWSQLNWYETWGTVAQPAHVHYVWPKSISTHVLSNKADASTNLFRFDCKKSIQYIVKFHAQWRVSVPDPRPTGVGVLCTLREHPRSALSLSADDLDDYSLVGHADGSPMA